MDLQRLQAKLELRELQLKIMAEQLSEHLKSLAHSDQKIQELEEKHEFLSKEINNRQEKLDFELYDKEMLLGKLQALESLFEAPIKPRSKKSSRTKSADLLQVMTTYVGFYTEIKFGPKKSSFKRLPVFPKPYDIETTKINTIDIKNELRKLAIDN